MKAHVRQLHIILKPIQKDTSSATEFVLRVKAIANSLLVVGDVVFEQDQIDFILNEHPEDFNYFVMKMYALMSLNVSMMLKRSSMSRRHIFIISVRSWPSPLFLQTL